MCTFEGFIPPGFSNKSATYAYEILWQKQVLEKVFRFQYFSFLHHSNTIPTPFQHQSFFSQCPAIAIYSSHVTTTDSVLLINTKSVYVSHR